MKITKNFDSSEFKCKCGCGKIKYNEKHVMRLQAMRNFFEKPIIITSAYRCPTHNKKIGGADGSFHLKGLATDIKIKGINSNMVADIAEKLFDGVGRYDTFTHVDSRGLRARWDMRTKKRSKK